MIAPILQVTEPRLTGVQLLRQGHVAMISTRAACPSQEHSGTVLGAAATRRQAPDDRQTNAATKTVTNVSVGAAQCPRAPHLPPHTSGGRHSREILSNASMELSGGTRRIRKTLLRGPPADQTASLPRASSTQLILPINVAAVGWGGFDAPGGEAAPGRDECAPRQPRPGERHRTTPGFSGGRGPASAPALVLTSSLPVDTRPAQSRRAGAAAKAAGGRRP